MNCRFIYQPTSKVIEITGLSANIAARTFQLSFWRIESLHCCQLPLKTGQFLLGRELQTSRRKERFTQSIEAMGPFSIDSIWCYPLGRQYRVQKPEPCDWKTTD